MRTKLLWIFAAVVICVFAGLYWSHSNHNSLQAVLKSPKVVKKVLDHPGAGLSPEIINKVLMTLKCASAQGMENSNTLVIIDYSKPSNKKRLWVFDLLKNKLLFYTYVSHGIKSGALLSNYFSNGFNSKASSIGVYNTEKIYRGRHGLSLKLYGLDKNFNDNAYSRSIVMHGAWYVEEDFIKKYGRPGRSWGCPAVPVNLIKPIINSINNKSLFVIYYPSNNWFSKSKFLNCENSFAQKNTNNASIEIPSTERIEDRDDVLYVDTNSNNKFEDSKPVAAVKVEDYQRLINEKIPLTRMLRRKINNTEYIALSLDEFKKISMNNEAICFVTAVVKMSRGYYVTELKILPFGKIKSIKLNENSSDISRSASLIVYFENQHAVNLKLTHQFIRWVGL